MRRKAVWCSVIMFIGLLLSGFTTWQVKSDKFRIIGYFYNKWGDVHNIQFKYLNTINYCFATVNPSNGLIREDFDPIKLKRLVARAKSHNVEVLLAIGGPNTSPQFKWFVRNPGMRRNFVKSALEMMRKYELDGIDIDWEYPELKDSSSQNFTLLLKELHAAFSKANKLISVDVQAIGYAADQIETKAFLYVDFLNIMAYDDDPKNQNSHSSYAMAEKAMNYWLKKRKLPKSKAILGVPSYGRTVRARRPVYYKDLLKRGANPQKDILDSVYYNGIPTIGRKTRLAKARGGGVIIWEINLDADGSNSLLKAIYDNTNPHTKK